jgi:hypothetical protein
MECTRGNVKAIMYDGYIPDKSRLLSSLKHLDQVNAITKDELSDLSHGARSLQPNNNSFYYFYNKMQYYIMTRVNCPTTNEKIPFYDALGNKIGKIKCFSQYYTTGTKRHSLELNSRKNLRHLNSPALYSSLCTEYQHLREKNSKEPYIQNVILQIIDSNFKCNGLNNCINNVVATLGFENKDDSSYINIIEFKNNWLVLLNNIIDKYHKLYFST